MTELEAVIQDYKHSGVTVQRPVRVAWADLSAEEKLGCIERTIQSFIQEGDAEPSHIVRREVDLSRLPPWRRKWIEETGPEAGPGAAGARDAFEQEVADLPRHWRQDGRSDAGRTWEESNDAEKIGYLVERTAKRRVPFEQLADAAAAPPSAWRRVA